MAEEFTTTEKKEITDRKEEMAAVNEPTIQKCVTIVNRNKFSNQVYKRTDEETVLFF